MTPNTSLYAVAFALMAPGVGATTWDCEVLQACEAGNCEPLGYEYTFRLEVERQKAIETRLDRSVEWRLVEDTRRIKTFAQPDDMEASYLILHRDGTLMTTSRLVDHGFAYILVNLGFCQQRD